ncbi:MAG: RNA-binding protein [Cyanosarcina radialis HA8281-LM2]|jgi:spoIIIJ-associated protein|nr:RNA-binding protein [Cyanosarcina radialis HA8281-LM2]
MSDRILERGQQWLEKLLHLAGFAATVTLEQPASASAVESDPNHWLTIDGQTLTAEQIDILIGAEGATIDAIQYLANSILNLNQESDLQAAYTVELNGYRLRRQEELQAMAAYAANTVRETGEEFVMTPLSAAERRQVHTILQDCEDLETFSRGQEPDRRLVVRKALT